MNQIDLSGRRAVVTGGAQGIGLSIVNRFLDSGAKVSLWDQDASLLEQTCSELESKGSVHAVVVELTDADAVAEAVLDAVKALGEIDIFVNKLDIESQIKIPRRQLLLPSSLSRTILQRRLQHAHPPR